MAQGQTPRPNPPTIGVTSQAIRLIPSKQVPRGSSEQTTQSHSRQMPSDPSCEVQSTKNSVLRRRTNYGVDTSGLHIARSKDWILVADRIKLMILAIDRIIYCSLPNVWPIFPDECASLVFLFLQVGDNDTGSSLPAARSDSSSQITPSLFMSKKHFI